MMQAADLFINLILNSDQNALSLVMNFLNILFLGFIKKDHESEMNSILSRLLHEEFLQKLQQLPYIYPVFIERLLSLLYVPDIKGEVKTAILATILPIHLKEEFIDIHLRIIIQLLHKNMETEAVFSWIETTVKSPDPDFDMRRKIVRFLTERILGFTPTVQAELNRILSDLVTINEWHSITELDIYRR
ncbi:MAG: hypothetical protein JXJ04_18925, partial [Spirochaetales bacterium]|nr:hypothetical protein [Spirochaetales bacterium]